MADDDDGDKTEDPTPRRLEEARKRGQVAVSRELNNWIMLAASTLLVATAGPGFMSHLADILTVYLEKPEDLPQVPGGFSQVLGATFWQVLGLMALPLVILMIAAFFGPFAQVGPLFSSEVLSIDFGKVSPRQGFGRIFSRRALVEFVKSLGKFGLIGAVIWIVLAPYYGQVDHFVGLPLSDIMKEMMTLFIRLMIGVLVALAVLAGVDVIVTRNEFMKKMRMTRQERKEEYKQSEGDPMVKAKLRQLRGQKARQRMMQNVPKADVVITNPTHFAIALQYKPDTMDAPLCLAKGADAIAFKIREVAKEHKITIVENPPLARILFDTVEIDEPVPPEHYKAVAEVISFVFKMRGNSR